ncbi:MAG: type II toxin-antitoxin system RelE/ParE family toxin [Deltaproteobacteria bacterium]|nr:type II toxin-antitoxin system RelE/ParE family toxin [Deltaproteobacteria bacterium]
MPIKYRVRITKTAEDDFKEIWTFIADDSVEVANAFVLQFENHIKTLELFPERCPLIPENKILGTKYRHLMHGGYRAIIHISGKTVYILRIVHGSRLLDSSMFERTLQ